MFGPKARDTRPLSGKLAINSGEIAAKKLQLLGISERWCRSAKIVRPGTGPGRTRIRDRFGRL